MLEKSNNKFGVLEELFEGYKWFLDLQKVYGNKFMVIHEKNINNKSLADLEIFLKIDHDDKWCNDFKKMWNIKPSYNHGDAFKNSYNKLIQKYF